MISFTFSVLFFQSHCLTLYFTLIYVFYSVEEVKLPGQLGACLSPSEELTARQRMEEQQRYVESLRQEIQAEQRRSERELEREQAHLRQQHSESKSSFHLHKRSYSLYRYLSAFKIQAKIEDKFYSKLDKRFSILINGVQIQGIHAF